MNKVTTKMRSLFCNINKISKLNSNLHDQLRWNNSFGFNQWRKRQYNIFSGEGNKNKLFCSFAISSDEKEIEHVVDGISFTIHDNSSRYKEETKNVPIVLVHGCYGSKKNFRFFSKMLKSSKIITLDLRNHGNSKHTDSMKYEEMENDIKNVLKKLEIKSCCLVGFSLGGKVSMYCALKSPTLFSYLVIMDILPLNYNSIKEHVQLPYNITSMTDILYKIKIKKKPQNKIEFLKYLKQEIPHISDTFANFICMSLKVNKEQNKLIWKINVDTIHKELSHLMDFPLDSKKHKYNNPCNFIIGKKSDLVYTIQQYDTIINSFFPTSKHLILENSSHTVYIDEAHKCAHVVNSVINA
ncbi:alpha/beta hydrolase, putative [Plasmodium ovale]|uniref:Alpha/beta hydrolase, putative n=1 Tax=Plasmodium ovale TaxID=36330 RepID=A0A1D3TIJ1_PLAOA|nr:alpha/beta hydrolase, putative [Plasmodium ovale]